MQLKIGYLFQCPPKLLPFLTLSEIKETKKSPNLNLLRLGERVEKIIKYEQYQLNRGLNVEIDFIQPSLNTEAGTGLVDVREITMT